MAKFTNILSQKGTSIVFGSVSEAKNFFYTGEALACNQNKTIRVEYELATGDTKLKVTKEFDTSGSGELHNTLQASLISAGKWHANEYTTEETSDHIY